MSTGLSLQVPKKLQPAPHTWANYQGPWIENYFYNYWQHLNEEDLRNDGIDRIYIPIFWTDYYVRYGLQKKHKAIQKFIDKKLTPDKKYFAIAQNDDGILEKLPKSVLVFSAGGTGDTPIPLLKSEPKSSIRERDIKCSFMGTLEGPNNRTGIRSNIFKLFKDTEDIDFFSTGSLEKFINITSRSLFTLCPRGYGRSSFRLYEAMALGSIPVYIWDDMEWLPYKDRLNWNEFAISINIKNIEKLSDIINSHTDEMIKKKQQKIQELYSEYFTLGGTCKQIIRMLKEAPNG